MAALARLYAELCYVRGSLVTWGAGEGGGWRFALRNPPLPLAGEVVEARLQVDGRWVSSSAVRYRVAGEVYPGDRIGPTEPLRFAEGQGAEVLVTGERLAPGRHRIGLWLRPSGFGRVLTRLEVEDEVREEPGPEVDLGSEGPGRAGPAGVPGMPGVSGRSGPASPAGPVGAAVPGAASGAVPATRLAEPPRATATSGFGRPVVLSNPVAYAVLNRAGDLSAGMHWFGGRAEVGGLYLPPARLVRTVRFGLRSRGEERGATRWLADFASRAELSPGCLSSAAEPLPGLRVEKLTFMAQEGAAVTSWLQLEAGQAAEVVLVVECVPALVPYGLGGVKAAAVDLEYEGEPGLVRWRGEGFAYTAWVGADRRPGAVRLDPREPRAVLEYELRPEPGLPAAIVVTVGGEVGADTAGTAAGRGGAAPGRGRRKLAAQGATLSAGALAGNPARQIEAAQRAGSRLLESSARVSGLGDRLDRAWDLALMALDTLWSDRPDIGAGLRAGLPRFPNYWSRDSAWAAAGLLAAGAAGAVREVLETFLNLQRQAPDADAGNIPSVISGAAFLHQTGYGASVDGPALMAALLAGYVLQNGDRQYAERRRENLRALVEWCARQDRDGDGFVDHGVLESTSDSLEIPDVTWMDHVDRRKSAIDVQALYWHAYRQAARLARLMGEEALAARWDGSANSLEDRTWSRFYPAGARHPADRLDREGRPDFSLRPNFAVALLYARRLPKARVLEALEAFEQSDLLAPHGVRTLAASDPRYDPTQYHDGCVWNLTTGWAAMALLRWGRVEGGLRLVEQLAERLDDEMGMMAELYRGDAPVPYNSCALQAWSAGVFLLAVGRYLLGLRPDGWTGTLTIDPRLPRGHAPVRVAGFPVGDSRVHILLSGDRFEVANEGPSPVRVLVPESGAEAVAAPGALAVVPLSGQGPGHAGTLSGGHR